MKNHQQILLDFADFAWLEQPEGNLMDAISRVWYNGSYTIAAKSMKTLELHYTMIEFLIKGVITWQGKSERSDRFFLGQDFAVRTVSVETVINCVFLVFESRQTQNKHGASAI